MEYVRKLIIGNSDLEKKALEESIFDKMREKKLKKSEKIYLE